MLCTDPLLDENELVLIALDIGRRKPITFEFLLLFNKVVLEVLQEGNLFLQTVRVGRQRVCLDQRFLASDLRLLCLASLDVLECLTVSFQDSLSGVIKVNPRAE